MAARMIFWLLESGELDEVFREIPTNCRFRKSAAGWFVGETKIFDPSAEVVRFIGDDMFANRVNGTR